MNFSNRGKMFKNRIAPISYSVLLAILLYFILTSRVLGATYYVDSINGDDLNNGKYKTSAWKTIQHAANILEAGDTTIVMEGTYNEKIVLRNSGNSENKIIIKSYPRRVAEINGGFNIDKSHIRIEGFKITSNIIGRTAIEIEGDYVEIVDNYCFNVKGKAIRGNLNKKPKGVYIAKNHIYNSQMGIVIEGNSWLVENNEIELLYDYGAGDCDYVRFFGDHNVIRNNYFHGTKKSDIGSAHVDCFQTWHNHPDRNARNILIENNKCFGFHQGFMGEVGGRPDLINHITFKNNIFKFTSDFYPSGYGIFNKGIPYVAVINNNFIDIRYRAVYMDDEAENAVVKNNIFYNCNLSYSFSGSSSEGDYNLIYLTPNNPNKGTHDLIGVDPLFVNPDNNDFSLNPSSPAFGSGEGGSDIGATFQSNAGAPSAKPSNLATQ